MVLDESTRQCVAIKVVRTAASAVTSSRSSPSSTLGTAAAPEHLRFGYNGPKFTAKLVQTVAGPRRCRDALHRAGQSVGEQLQRERQR